MQSRKIFLIIYSTLYGLSDDTSSLNSFSWIYQIDGPKLTEQKKPFEYVVPPPTKVGRNKYVTQISPEIADSAISIRVLTRNHCSLAMQCFCTVRYFIKKFFVQSQIEFLKYCNFWSQFWFPPQCYQNIFASVIGSGVVSRQIELVMR